jgi:hypothetical protein
MLYSTTDANDSDYYSQQLDGAYAAAIDQTHQHRALDKLHWDGTCTSIAWRVDSLGSDASKFALQGIFVLLFCSYFGF